MRPSDANVEWKNSTQTPRCRRRSTIERKKRARWRFGSAARGDRVLRSNHRREATMRWMLFVAMAACAPEDPGDGEGGSNQPSENDPRGTDDSSTPECTPADYS